VIDRALESMFHWYRLVGEASEGARAFERDGVLAAVVPAAPERAVVNAVLYRSADGLEAAYEDVAAAYRAIGAKWTVWVPPGDDGVAAASFLESRGHVLDAEPMAMVHERLDTVERPSADDLPDWTAEGSISDVGEINDRAYPFGTDSFSRALRTAPDGAVHVYVARDGRRPVGCMTAADVGGNTEIQMVAVLPEARGRGISGKLLRHALADAAERGMETSTLVATNLGMPNYERAGYRPIDRMSMWERAPES
jgi:ribosomal protein S18 acetylase RimI-like enzyme